MSLKKGPRFHKRTDFKLALWYVLTFLVTVLLVFCFMYFRLQHHLIKDVDRFLEDDSKELVLKIQETPADFARAIEEYEGDILLRRHYPIYFRVLNPDGGIVAASENFAGMSYSTDLERLKTLVMVGRYFETVRPPGRSTPYRVGTFRLVLNGKTDYLVQIGTSLRFTRKTLSNFRRNLLTAIPIVLVLGAVGGWYLARRSLSPIGQITRAAQRITASNLGERIESKGSGDELDHLIETLNDMISRLDGSFRRITQFTADASHELRTPIAAMKGEAELLLSTPRPLREYRGVLARHLEKLDFLTRLINDLILLSKFDSRETDLVMGPVRLNELLMGLWELFEVLAEQKGIRFAAGEIEEADVLGDRTRLQQLFTNLIDNAIKFTPSGGQVDISVRRDGRFARVLISDTGIGIPKEEFDHVFERFYRVDKSRARTTGGIGLGLSICQWIAKAHHGRIDLQSELGKGTRFIVSLPLLPDR